MTRRAHTKAEQEHLTKVACLGCICCRMDGRGTVPCQIHHIREGYGIAQRATHFEVLPLCEGHHQGLRAPADPTKIAFHRNREAWVAKYGTERALVDHINQTIKGLDESNPGWWEFALELQEGA